MAMPAKKNDAALPSSRLPQPRAADLIAGIQLHSPAAACDHNRAPADRRRHLDECTQIAFFRGCRLKGRSMRAGGALPTGF